MVSRACRTYSHIVACSAALLVALAAALWLGAPTAFAAQDASDANLTAGSFIAAQSGDSDEVATVEVGSGAKSTPVTTSTPTATASTASGANVEANAYVQSRGWTSWTQSGALTGTKTSRGLRAFRLKLSNLPNGLNGSINYRAYDKGVGWTSVYSNGKGAGRKSVSIQAVRVWLSGSVAKHYDVLYRLYIKGHGWRKWVKNKSVNGLIRKNTYATAIQVLVSPKTEEAAGNTASTVGARYEARMTTAGWQKWVGNGKTAGKAVSGKVMDGFSLNVDPGSISGSAQFRAYLPDEGWTSWTSNGGKLGDPGNGIEALQAKLTGTLASKYDLYYRTYVSGFGWLDWAKNGATSGSTGLDMAIAAVQIKLVKKGASAPGKTKTTTVNQTYKTLNGIDISSWQAGINLANVPADFVIVKATGGTGYTNPYFKLMANATLKTGKLLGLYHFARERGCSGTAAQEADYFVNAVGPYVGKAVLVLDWESDALFLGPTWAKQFLDRVYKKTGVRPLIYMSKYPTSSYDWSSVAPKYKLWVAQYADMSPTGYQLNPWTDDSGYGAWDRPTIFQYSSSGSLSGYGGSLDLNIFYGKAADWKALAAKK